MDPAALATAALAPELARRGIVNAGDAIVFTRVHSDLGLTDANFVELQQF